MKQNKTVFERLKGKEAIYSLGLFIQFVLLIAMIILAICTLFVPEFKVALQVLVVLLLFTMGYNNHTVFKRKGFTLLYIIAGFAFLFTIIMG